MSSSTDAAKEVLERLARFLEADERAYGGNQMLFPARPAVELWVRAKLELWRAFDHYTLATAVERENEQAERDRATAAPIGNDGARDASASVSTNPPQSPALPGRLSCNRHTDCRAADHRASAKGSRAHHCYDEHCEDCFGS